MEAGIAWLAGWYNWPFLLPLAVGVIFILVDFTLGGVSDLIGLDADADVDVPDPGLDVDVDADFDLSAAPDIAAAEAGGFLLSGLAWMGLGKVPVSVLFEVMFIVFGSVGLLVNAVASDLLPIPSGLVLPVALLAGAITAPIATRAVGSFIASIVPADASTTRAPAGFTGEVGVAASVITHSVGQVRIAATATHPATILTARCDASVEGDLARGLEVLLVDYDAAKNIYIAVPNPLEP